MRFSSTHPAARGASLAVLAWRTRLARPLAAGALALGGAAAFTVVLTEMLAVTAISAAILFVAYDSYARGILGVASKVTHNRRTFSVFLGAIVAVPAVLLLL